MTGSVFPGGLRADGLPAALSDPRRVAVVQATGLLDTEPEPAFDNLADLATAITGCERAFVTLVDEDRSFWKSCVGVDLGQTGGRQSPVRESFCYYLVGLGGGRFVVDDAAEDPRTRDHPSVAPMKIGAWAGYPILGPGDEVLGSMCVIDENPRHWQPAELAVLATLARAVSNEINLRGSLAETRESLLTAETLARSLQDSLLPPVLRLVPGLDVAAWYQPAAGGTTVVGDFYDLFNSRGPWWSVVVGDVCGKGVEAAKVTALARYTLRADAAQILSPAEILRRLNAALLDQRQDDRFLTAAYATFRVTPDGVAGRLCCAGHPQPLVRRADGRVHQVNARGSLLGYSRDVELADVRFRLAPGDTLLLYTDGATEARARPASPEAVRAQFGEDALARTLTGTHGLDAAATVGSISQILATHTGDWASDDTALLALRVPPRP
jgi:serine phosphatase RsbU (regulator of sigma subunit)